MAIESKDTPTLSPAFISGVLKVSLSGLSKDLPPFKTVTTDSRKAGPGSLFVALQGEKLDGHDYIEKAISQGASGILCQKDKWNANAAQNAESPLIFRVDDSLLAYRQLAAAWRSLFHIPVIAVAGSAGKTTTKEFLASILQGKWTNVLKTEKSQNGFIGIPMTLLELRPEHQAAVIEVGIDAIGAMQQHLDLVAPTAAVLTVIGPEHLELLQDVPTVAREEGIAFSHVGRTGGTLSINLDDPWLRPYASDETVKGRKIAFTLAKLPGNLEGLSGKWSPEGEFLLVEGLGISQTSYPMPLPGKHNATNLLAAICTAMGLGLTPAEMNRGLTNFIPAEGRSHVQVLPGPFTVVCDYYNAQPLSVRSGLELLVQLASSSILTGQKWACLADMLELGKEEERFHRELANIIIHLRIDHLVLYGPRMKFLEDELKLLNYGGTCRHFSSHSELAQDLIQNIKPSDFILIKGSRSMKMEEVWKQLENHTRHANSKSP